MPIYNEKDEVSYIGSVLKIEEHMWMDGMLEENAVVWDKDTKEIKYVKVGYYGMDGYNLCGCHAVVDADMETIHSVLKMLKGEAINQYAQSVTNYKQEVRKGRNVEVVRGRKIPKGTKLNVFWVGEKPTYRSRNYSWMNETETIAGCFDENGNKVWIKAEYLKPIDLIQSPNAKERDKYIKNYIKKNASRYNIYVR